MGTAVEKCIQW